MAFKKATKEKAFARIAEFGLSGGGKTFTALRLAKGFLMYDPRMEGKRIAVIDSEVGSASKYSHLFDFDVDDINDCSVDNYVRKIEEAKAANYGILIIDSMTHGWQDLLSEVDELAKAKYRGNTWSAWSEGTPKQKRLVRAIQQFPGHIIVTMRASTEWNQEKDEKTGRIKPVRIGLKPEAGKGIEYEFDLLFEFNSDHYCNVIKDRTGGPFQDRIVHLPNEEFAKEIADWLNTGAEPETKKEYGIIKGGKSSKFAIEMEKLGDKIGGERYSDFLLSRGIFDIEKIEEGQRGKIYLELKKLTVKLNEAA